MSDVETTTPFERIRPRLFGLAYRMTGSRADAEDLVQETYVRWHQADRAAIANAEAWLVTATTRLAIDRLRRRKIEREAYAGPWLPEPLVSAAPPPDRDVELDADLSVAFLTLLERLAPDERAAFLLHDVFDVDYAEIASALDRSEAACRQVVHRARERVRGARKRFEATAADRLRLLRAFMDAVQARDDRTLLSLFTDEIAWTSDGGGKVHAAPHPILGAARVRTLVMAVSHKYWDDGRALDLAVVNGEPGLCIRDAHGGIVGAIAIDVDGARIAAVYVVLNPDKLSSASGEARPVTS